MRQIIIMMIILLLYLWIIVGKNSTYSILGDFDKVEVWKKALTKAEISNMWKKECGGKNIDKVEKGYLIKCHADG